MISLETAKQIVNRNKEKNKNIYGVVQTDELFIFTVMTKEQHSSKHLDIGYDDYVRIVNKRSGEYDSLNFEEYCKLVELNKIQKI